VPSRPSADPTDGMLPAASQTIAGLVDMNGPGAGVLPDVRSRIGDGRRRGRQQAARDGATPELPDPHKAVQEAMCDTQLQSRPTGTGATGTRTESDSMGTIEVPAERYRW
jgi:hypothetical protein